MWSCAARFFSWAASLRLAPFASSVRGIPLRRSAGADRCLERRTLGGRASVSLFSWAASLRLAPFASGLLLLATGCELDDQVALTGVIWDGPGDTSPSLAGAEVTVLDELGEPVGVTTSDAAGSFALTVPGGVAVFVVVRKDGYATTSFPGVLGVGEQRAEDHTLYAVPLEDVEAERATYAGCAGTDSELGLAYGEVRVFGIIDDESLEHPSVGTATAKVIGVEAEDDRRGCYLDAFGAKYEPRRDETGPAGRFAVFDLVPGLHRIHVRFSGEGWSDVQDYPMWIPDDPASVSPWFPLWVDFPF